MPTPKASSAVPYAIRAALAATGRVLLFRNTGGFDDSKSIRYGLGVGGGDYVGCVRLYANNDIGRYFELEVKTGTGRQSEKQLARARAVRAFGGYYGLAHTVEEALYQLDCAARGEP